MFQRGVPIPPRVKYRAFWVLAVSGLLGFRVGIVGYPTWQIAVETAQVVAGLVQYPPDNPFYIYHTKLWSLAIQLCAVALRAGMSEMTLSLLLSGLLGMISFQALAMIVYAIGGSASLAIGGAFVVFASRVTDHGVVYPIFLLGTHHTYGALGLSLFVLVIALIGAGFYRTGLFLLGMAPAVHPSVGVWVGAVAAIAFAWDFRRLRDEFRPAWKYFAAGCAVTLLSLFVQYTFIYHRTHADPAAVAKTFTTFVNLWDDHRRAAAGTASVGVIFNRLVLALGLMWLIGFSRDLPVRSVFVLRVAVVAAAISLAFVFVSWLPPGSLPMTLSILMPARLLNFDVMIAVPFLLGLMALYRQKLSIQLLTLILLMGVLFSRGSMFWAWAAEHQWSVWSVPVDPTLVLEMTGLGLVCVALSNLSGSSSHGDDSTARRIASIAVRAATVCVMLVAFVITWRVAHPANLRDRTNDPFFREVAGDHRGLIVTAGTFQLVQLYTRRPVLIDSGALDTMVYAPESGPALAKILGDVYGIDFFNPPPEVRSASAVPHPISRANWAQMSREQWQQIRKTYNVTQIVTPHDYVLDLPIAAENEQLRLYRIP
jgi:hypothetical protein